MKVAVLRFPGSNCDQDALHGLNDHLNIAAEYVWHQDHSLAGYSGVFVPGGFSYGDYLRCGAIAARSPIMSEVARLANEGYPVIGVCNGFQILCEAGLLPGVLVQNERQKFICDTVKIVPVNKSSAWTQGSPAEISIPIAHNEGRFVATEEELKRLEQNDQVAFRYLENPNGSMNAIAGVLNTKGNVLGMMPHPERAVNPLLGSTEGASILRGFSLVRV